jgi:hypothetical protein
LEEDPQLEQNVVWTDEAKFHLSSSVNRHNCVYWRTSNPNVEVEYNDTSPGVIVWSGVTYQGVLGPFFFEDGVNSENYLELIRNTVYPLLQQRDHLISCGGSRMELPLIMPERYGSG